VLNTGEFFICVWVLTLTSAGQLRA
jgi:hypothetical protein